MKRRMDKACFGSRDCSLTIAVGLAAAAREGAGEVARVGEVKVGERVMVAMAGGLAAVRAD